MTRSAAKWFLLVMLVWVLIALAIAVGVNAWAHIAGVLVVRSILERARPWLLLWRIAVFFSLMIWWRPIIKYVARRFELTPSAEMALYQWKWRAGAGLVLIDLVLAENVLGALQHVL